MAIESIPVIIEEIEKIDLHKFFDFLKKLFIQQSQVAPGTESVSLTPVSPAEETEGGAPPVGDEIARSQWLFFWQKLTGLQGDVQALIRDLNHGVPQDISSEVEAGKALGSKFDALMDQYDPNNPFITPLGRDMYSEIVAANYELKTQLAFLETAREQLDSGTLNEEQRQAVIDKMKDAKKDLVKSLEGIKFNLAIRQA